MIDIHSHIIPQADDGSKSIEETFNILKEAQDAGYTDIILTSHFIEGHYELNKIDRQAWVAALNESIKKENININLYPGAEIFVSQSMCQNLKDGTICTLNNSRYVLFELPMNSKTIYLNEVIFELISMDLVPIIAHPERYAFVQKDPNILIDFIEMGVLFQGNIASISGYYGSEAKKTIKKLLQNNMIHFLGSDNHRQNTIYADMNNIKEELKKVITLEEYKLLTEINPRKIINNEEIATEQPKKIKEGFTKFFRRN